MIRGLRLYAFHGCNDFEKKNGQDFELDIELELDTGAVAASDDIRDTVNYSSVIRVVKKAFTGRSRDTIECAAHDVARAVLADFGRARSVRVCLKKPGAPLKADLDFVGTEITLGREDI